MMPVYNEEASVGHVIEEHLALLEQMRDELTSWEILCLDDGSNDRTWEVLKAIQAQHPIVRLLRHERNAGIHQSLLDLYHAVQGTYVYVTASDGQWPATNLRSLWQELKESDADLVVGVRRNRWRVYSLWRLIISALFNLLPLLLFGVKTGDAGSNKLGRSEIFRVPIVSRSPFAEAERIIKARIDGYRVSFGAIEFLPRTSGKTTGASWKNILASLRDVVRCVRQYGIFPRKSS
jgi:glycosyltransferase involved in cell wall biosynthesis